VIVTVLVGPESAVGGATCAAACTGAVSSAALALATGGGDWWIGALSTAQELGVASQGRALKIKVAVDQCQLRHDSAAATEKYGKMIFPFCRFCRMKKGDISSHSEKAASLWNTFKSRMGASESPMISFDLDDFNFPSINIG
jgi:hypothetical protein